MVEDEERAEEDEVASLKRMNGPPVREQVERRLRPGVVEQGEKNVPAVGAQEEEQEDEYEGIDLDKLSIKELKDLIDDNGGDASRCLEKKDLIDEVRRSKRNETTTTEMEDDENDGIDFDKLTIAELKDLIEENGGDASKCLEKIDLIHEVKRSKREAQALENQNENEHTENSEEEEEENETLMGSRPVGMSRKQLHKSQKQKEKEERQEAWRHKLEHDRRIRLVREEEDTELERKQLLRDKEFESEQAKQAKQAKQAGVKKAAPLPQPAIVSDDDVARFCATSPNKLITLKMLREKFLTVIDWPGVMNRIATASRQNNFRGEMLLLSPTNNQLLRVNQDDYKYLNDYVLENGSVSHVQLVEQMWKRALSL